MTDTLANAALAFDNVSTGSGAPQETGDGGPVESMFPNLGVLDADSPEAGGDDLPVRERKVKPVARGNKEVDLDADAFEAALEDEEVDPEVDDEDEEVDPNADDAPEDEDEDAEKEDGPVYEVMVDGERQEVSLEEALKGYIREKTFHQRLETLNGYRGALRDEAIKVTKQRQEYAEVIDSLKKHLDLLVPQEPDWSAEYQRDPVGAKALQEQYNQYTRQRQALDVEAKRVQEESARVDKENMEAWTKQENAKILQNFPSWTDEKIRAKALTAMAETAREAGFSDEEIMDTKDSRMITLLHKAMRWDRLQKSKGLQPVPKAQPKRTVKPGAGRQGNPGTATTGQRQAQRQLLRSGSIDDAAAVMTNLIRPPKRR